LERIDQICDRYEAARLAGQQPRIADYLRNAAEADRSALLRELLLLERAYLQSDQRRRWQRGEHVLVRSYLEEAPSLRDYPELVFELVCGEVLLREELGESPRLADYLELVPTHQAKLRRFFVSRQLLPPVTLQGLSDRATLPAAQLITDVEPNHTVDELPPARESAPAPSAPERPAALDEAMVAPSGYEILGELGRGGMGVVYKAYDLKRGQTVALKTLLVMQPDRLFRFKQEFRLHANLNHPNLVTLYELVADRDPWFFTMEYLEGVDFLKYVRAENCERTGRALLDDRAYARLRTSLRQLGEGVAALHQAGRLHRDIKPSNVLVTTRGRVVLLDFGLATEWTAAGLLTTEEGQILGTVAYMSPEQAAGESLSLASDWYSVGVVLYEALTGRLPFCGAALQVLRAKQLAEAPDLHEAAPDAPEDLARLCTDLVRRDPGERPSGPEVLRRLAQDSAAAPTLPQVTSVPLIGRERHLAVLAGAFTALDRGRPVIVRILGSSGVGKTTLVQHFLKGVQRDSRAVVLTGRCYEQESIPYKALDGVIDGLSRFLRRLSPQKAEALLPRDVVPLLRVFPVLRRVEALAAAPHLPDTPDPQELRRRGFTALRELLGRLADRWPLVFCVDDLQWGDADSAGLLAELLRPPGAPVVLFLGCYRNEEVAASPFARALEPLWPQIGEAVERRQLIVEALSQGEARELADLLLRPTSAVAAAAADAVARESGGIPFFVQELVQHLQTGAVASASFALDEVLWSRIAQLPAAARDLLTVVATSARPLPQAVARRATECGDYLGALTLLRTGRLTWGTGPGEGDLLVSYHDRVREAVRAHLSAAESRGFHLRLAEALEGWGEADPEWLALHWEGAGEEVRAGTHYARAADQAADALAFDHAAELYRRVLRLGHWEQWSQAGRQELQTRLADALANGGRGGEAAREYLQAAEMASGLQAVELRRRAATQLLNSGHVDEGLTLFRVVLKSMGLTTPMTRKGILIGLLLRRLQLRFRGLRFRERGASSSSTESLTSIDVCWSALTGMGLIDTLLSAYHHIRGLLLSLRSGEPYRIVRAMTSEAMHVATAGGRSHGQTTLLLQTAEEIARRVSNPHARGMLLLARGVAHFLVGCWRAALTELDHADEIFRKHCTGVAWELDTDHTFALWSMTYMGWFRELTHRWPALVSDARDRGDRYAVTNLSTYIMAVAKLCQDAPEQAQVQLRQVMEQWSKQGFHIQHHNAALAQVLIYLYLGNGVDAFQHIKDRWPFYRSSFLLRIQQVRINIVLLRAQSAIAAAAATGAKTFLRAAEADARSLRREKMPWSDALVPLVLAGVASVRGDSAKAIRLLRGAIDRLHAVDMEIFAQAARRRLGQLLGGHEGRLLIEESEAWMVAQEIGKPARMAAVFAPCFLD
jgi:serine/threonine protein kinase